MKFITYLVMAWVSIPLVVAQYFGLYFDGSTPIATGIFVGNLVFFYYRKLPVRQQWGTLLWFNGTLWFLLPFVSLVALGRQDFHIETFFLGWGSWFTSMVWQMTTAAIYIAIGKYLCSGRKNQPL